MIVILEFGSQYTQLVRKRLDSLNVSNIVLPGDTLIGEIFDHNPDGIILSGGSQSIGEEGAIIPDARIFSGKIPVLGICYGLQVALSLFGGVIGPAEKHEYGEIRVTPRFPISNQLFKGLNRPFTAWASHRDECKMLPAGFEILASTENCQVAAVKETSRHLYLVQFHPETSHCFFGDQIFRNFAIGICGAKTRDQERLNYWLRDIRSHLENYVKDNGKVLLGLSGGVDSTVLAYLLHAELGDQLQCLFIDQGTMREGEVDALKELMKSSHISCDFVNASDRFLDLLEGVRDPEAKRIVVGHQFVQEFKDYAETHGPFTYLAQGTLASDVIESGDGKSAKIKSHHNVGGLPAELGFQLLEPFRNLFKDDVRQIGRELGVPDYIINRHPFPGPGLAIRIIGEVTRESLTMVRKSDTIVREELTKEGLYDEQWQIFTVLLPTVRSVGVMGDSRTYGNPIVIRCVTSQDGMTADFSRLPWDLLGKMSNRIVNEVPGVNRVMYDVTSKPPGTIEYE